MQIQHDNLLELAKYHIRRLNVGQMIVGMCIVGLSVWCAMNVVSIMDKYYRHETIISLQNDPPNRTGFPGITICAPSIFTPHKLAELYPSFKKRLQNFIHKVKSIKSEEADLLIANEMEKRANLLHHYESMALQTYNATSVINDLSVQPEDLLEDCMFYPMSIRSFQLSQDNTYHRSNSMKCSDMKSILESIYEGKKCFTYFSDLVDLKKLQSSMETILPNEGDCKSPQYCQSEPNDFLKDSRDQMVFDLNPRIEVRLKSIENDVWSAFVTEPILMTVHPPNILQNRRDFLFFQVTRSNFYEISFTNKTTHLLPPPHKTMCIKYREEAKYQMDHIKTRDQCISVCINLYSPVNEKDCANYYSVLTDSMFYKEHAAQKICNHSNQVLSYSTRLLGNVHFFEQNYNNYLEARAYCEKQCSAECTKTIYEITGQIRNTLEDNCLKWYQLIHDDKGESIDDGEDIHDSNDEDELLSQTGVDIDTNEDSQSDTLNMMRTTTYLPLLKYGHSIDRAKPEETTASKSDIFYSSDSLVNMWQAKCNARVSIRISPKPFTIVRHQQAITYEGFLGTIGGHVGIWLGLSLYKVIKFTVHILYHLLHKMVSKCSPKFAQPVSEPSHD